MKDRLTQDEILSLGWEGIKVPRHPFKMESFIISDNIKPVSRYTLKYTGKYYHLRRVEYIKGKASSYRRDVDMYFDKIENKEKLIEIMKSLQLIVDVLPSWSSK